MVFFKGCKVKWSGGGKNKTIPTLEITISSPCIKNLGSLGNKYNHEILKLMWLILVKKASYIFRPTVFRVQAIANLCGKTLFFEVCDCGGSAEESFEAVFWPPWFGLIGQLCAEDNWWPPEVIDQEVIVEDEEDEVGLVW